MEDPRTLLTAKLAEIDAQMTTMAAPPAEQSNISFGKRVGEGTQMAVDRLAQVGVHEKLRTTRADVLRALAKLDDGTYGVCGKPIPAGRLEVHPWAVLCVEDAGRGQRS
jgi:DnaK suppressor protein